MVTDLSYKVIQRHQLLLYGPNLSCRRESVISIKNWIAGSDAPLMTVGTDSVIEKVSSVDGRVPSPSLYGGLPVSMCYFVYDLPGIV